MRSWVEPFALPAGAIEYFRAEGYVKLKKLFSPELLKFYGEAITRQVVRLNTLTKPMAERATYERAFLQVMNLWTKDEICRQFSFGKRLARVAAQLMGVKGVRIYHDQALYKEAGGGFTPWHADQYYWPLSNDNTCTAWVPLQTTPLEMGPLAFAAPAIAWDLGGISKLAMRVKREFARCSGRRSSRIWRKLTSWERSASIPAGPFTARAAIHHRKRVPS